VDGFERLVRLLEEVLRERCVRLLAVPRAAVRCAELRHDLDELAEGVPGRSDEALLDVRWELRTPRGGGHPRTPGLHYGRNPDEFWTTIACVRSKWPYCGFTTIFAARTRSWSHVWYESCDCDRSRTDRICAETSERGFVRRSITLKISKAVCVGT